MILNYNRYQNIWHFMQGLSSRVYLGFLLTGSEVLGGSSAVQVSYYVSWAGWGSEVLCSISFKTNLVQLVVARIASLSKAVWDIYVNLPG